jgi:transposase
LTHPLILEGQKEQRLSMTDIIPAIPDPEVSAHRTQRRYSTAFKLRILSEVDTLVGPGEVAALLRREGMYASTLSDFRTQMAKGKLTTSAAKSLPAPARSDAHDRQVAKLEREVRTLRRDLARATLVIDVQKKVSELLGITLAEVPEDHER